MARQLLADPETPQKIMEGRDADIVHCLRCFTCMAERAATATRRCTVNPLIGRELDGTEIKPAPVKKKVLVVGDAAKVSTITNAVYWGYWAALDI
ncbi:hypothetical protein [Megasphaera sp.]|uniref:hypothetical protein n=1 Tax=Megasphaera sp. TaxID=2023260 RepID=UPI00352231A8